MKYFLITAVCFLTFNFFAFEAVSQNDGIIVQGTVTSSDYNETLIGVNVTEFDGTNRAVGGTITDINGQYVIRVANVNNRLEFSYVGYKKENMKISDKKTINVVLEPEGRLEEVVVTASRSSRQGGFAIPAREMSTAVQSINTKEFEGLAITSIDDALQGQIAGLDIVANSGDPGSASTMRIRGVNSINGNSEPLIVLNGTPYTMDIDPSFDFTTSNEEQYANMLSINPDDIEEIQVLKDAAASAIWGTRGANGVIMITTKKGVTGPTRVIYTYRYTQTKQPTGREMLSGDDYTMYIKEAYLNPRQDDEAANKPEYNYDRNYPDFENYNNNTDWRKEVSQIGHTHNHNLSISGGGERALYRLSGEYHNQGGTVIGQNLERLSSRLYFEYNVSDRIQFTSETAFTHTDNERSYENLLDIAYKKMPNVSIYAQDTYGNNTTEFFNIPRDSRLHDDQKNLKNPIALAELATNRLRSTRIVPKIGLRYHLMDPSIHRLTLQMDATFDINNDKTNKFLPISATNLLWSDKTANRAEDASSERLNIFADVNLSFVPTFTNKDHSLTLYQSMQVTSGNSSSQQIVTSGLPSDQLSDASNFGYSESSGNGRSSWRGLAFLSRGHYAYQGKYILSGTLRWDGSTRFGKGNKWATSPGVSAKWIISDEKFLDSTNDWLDMLALRASWGVSGSQPGSEYLHFSRYSVYGTYIDIPAVKPNSLRLDDLKWETNTASNYGLELGMFDNRVWVDFNYYTNRIEDMLFQNVAISTTSGYSTLSYINGGVMENKGWELYLNFNNFIKIGDFGMDFKLNFADNTNKLIELDPYLLKSFNTEFDFKNGTYLTRIQENNSYGSIYGFKYKGTYKYDKYETAMAQEGRILDDNGKPLAPFATDADGNVILDHNGKPKPMYFSYNRLATRHQFRGGDAIYEDINNDGSIDELDIVYLGNSNPKLNGGFGLNLRYKRFTVRSFFNFRYGNKIVNTSRMYAENMYADNNQSIAVNWRWRKDGDETDMPRALYNYGYNWLGSDRYIEDGSFVRFKYLQFNYDVPPSLLKKYSLNRLSFYLTINNLYVWTNYTGVDPEVGYGNLKSGRGISYDGNSTPRSKDFVLGVTIGI
ncbi:SusC/RagA family TonB-linked outer membrane protein [Bacteroidales bacterium OttesenSCG-928-L03]|nr:SusC/RagA family TonB-linked outer membrane protein [Bacteroidales bacterium OttesenSCG-928-L03]